MNVVLNNPVLYVVDYPALDAVEVIDKAVGRRRLALFGRKRRDGKHHDCVRILVLGLDDLAGRRAALVLTRRPAARHVGEEIGLMRLEAGDLEQVVRKKLATSFVRPKPHFSGPSTSADSAARENTRPGCSDMRFNKRNSTGVRASGVPRTSTSKRTSSSTSAAGADVACGSGCPRRSTAFTRATTSRGLKGLQM